MRGSSPALCTIESYLPPLHLSSDAIFQEIFIDRFRRGLVFILSSKKIAQNFSRSAELSESSSMLRIDDRQVQKF